jgi:hypothetical protein
MHFATRVRTWSVLDYTVYSVLYSEMALPRKPLGIGHIQICTFLLRMAETMTSQNTDLSSWDTLYTVGERQTTKKTYSKLAAL